MKVNVNGTWKESKPHVNVGGTWKAVSIGWVNVNGTWKKFYTSSHEHHITASTNNFNLFKTIGIPDGDEIIVTIDAGVTIGATSTGTPAFNIGNDYTGKTVTIINNGVIGGRGGNGGHGSDLSTSGAHPPGANGGAGGTALYSRTANKVILINNGKILGGAGGGAGGGQMIYHGSITHLIAGSGGGGGQGTPNGSPGRGGRTPVSGKYYHAGRAGSGTRGGARVTVGPFYGGQGGNGGAFGKNGGAGGRAYNPGHDGWYSNGGRGGAAGKAIDGNSRVEVQTTGTIQGPRVN